MTLKAQVLICIVLIIALIAIVNQKKISGIKICSCLDLRRYYSVYFYAVSINNGTCCSIFWNLFSCKYDLLYGICSFTCNYFYIDSGIIKSNCKSQETCTDDCVTG